MPNRTIAFLGAGNMAGSKSIGHLEENIAAVDIELTRDDLARIDEVAPKGIAAGDRYPSMAAVNA
jgi:aryl-alcohol dehydrogenase-like predicted oxidoreductase